MKSKPLFGFIGCTGLLITLSGQTCLGDVQFDTEIISLNLGGGPFPMPLASDPGNALGDSIDGYGFVDSQVTITASSQRATPGPPSQGQACGNGPCAGAPIDPATLDGTSHVVDSFFDVFFDIQVTDVDSRPGRDYAGQPDGASLMFQDVLMTNLQAFHSATFDDTQESFGLLLPPESSPYVTTNSADIPLGGDINGNGTLDKLVLSFFLYSVGDTGRVDSTLISNQLWQHTYDSGAKFEGYITDVTDTGSVAFAIGAQLPNGLPDPAVFGGRDTVESQLINPLVPEPASAVLLGLGALAMFRRRVV